MENSQNDILGVIWDAEYGGNIEKFKKSSSLALGVVSWWIGVENSTLLKKSENNF